jgi:lipoprotein-anchoring transpeptidase ErfK/SrfK
MHQVIRIALVTGALIALPSLACARPLSHDPARYGRTSVAMPPDAEPSVPTPQAPDRLAAAGGNHLGGGFIEFLFSGGSSSAPRSLPGYRYEPDDPTTSQGQPAGSEPAQPEIDPKFLKQEVDYDGNEPAGTIVIDTPRKFLFLVEPGGKALRYGIGVGRPGFTWAGVKQVSLKREWPDWRPPPDMLKRRPDLPPFMAGGPENPLGARALYLGSSLYRIHGSNEPWTIGTQVSSGCIRMRNEDVMDLYERVKVGAKVLVI